MKREEKHKNNLEVFMENGPGLSTRYQTWIVARDRKRNRMLLDGLGGMGCGRMWVGDDGSHANDPEYADAPERDSWMQFGTEESMSELMKTWKGLDKNNV